MLRFGTRCVFLASYRSWSRPVRVRKLLIPVGRGAVSFGLSPMPRTGAFASTTDEVWQADLDLKLFARFAWHGSHGRKWSSSVGEGI